MTIDNPNQLNEVVPGCLYLVGTPIGNLGDLSPRAVAVLSAVDRIAAEDTRRTLRLLNALSIRKSLISYHEHNQSSRGPELADRLQAGESIALVSDAGMPCISDPGEALVRLCAERGIPVVAIPGPTAALTALSLSALSTERFVFEGFLPTEGRNRRERLAQVTSEPRTVILYEAPHRLRKTLAALAAADLGDRLISLARELTKRYESVLRLTVHEATQYYAEHEPIGEFVLILEGLEAFQIRHPEAVSPDFQAEQVMAVDNLLENLLAQGLSVKAAAAEAAKRTGGKKNELYRQALNLRKDPGDSTASPS